MPRQYAVGLEGIMFLQSVRALGVADERKKELGFPYCSSSYPLEGSSEVPEKEDVL